MSKVGILIGLLCGRLLAQMASLEGIAINPITGDLITLDDSDIRIAEVLKFSTTRSNRAVESPRP